MTPQTPRENIHVGLLGVGLMGSAMAHRLLDQDIAVVAWDRNADHARELQGRGGQAAETPSDVVRRARVVITMLPTAEVILNMIEPLLNDWPEDTIWLQMSSVGAAEADQLTQAAQAHAITLVDAPVSGSTLPAEDGQLTILASGPDSARTAVEPIFDALATRVLWVGAAGMGSRLKLAANHWMITMVVALAESMQLCQAMGLDEQHFITLLDGGPLGSAYALQKLDEMRRHRYPAGFPVRLALKDLQLVSEVVHTSRATMPLLDVVLERFQNRKPRFRQRGPRFDLRAGPAAYGRVTEPLWVSRDQRVRQTKTASRSGASGRRRSRGVDSRGSGTAGSQRSLRHGLDSGHCIAQRCHGSSYQFDRCEA